MGIKGNTLIDSGIIVIMKLIYAFVLIATTWSAVNCGLNEFVMKNMPFASKEQIVQIITDCKAEVNVEEEVFEQLERGELPEKRELKCFFKCFGSKFGTLKENGEIDLAPMENAVTKKQYDIIAKCSTIKADDLCDQIYNVHKCYAQALKEQNIVL